MTVVAVVCQAGKKFNSSFPGSEGRAGQVPFNAFFQIGSVLLLPRRNFSSASVRNPQLCDAYVHALRLRWPVPLRLGPGVRDYVPASDW